MVEDKPPRHLPAMETSLRKEGEEIMYIKSPTGKRVRVSSKVRVGKPNSKRQRSYCARSGKIKGSWARDKNSRNWLQRRRWKCPKLPFEA